MRAIFIYRNALESVLGGYSTHSAQCAVFYGWEQDTFYKGIFLCVFCMYLRRVIEFTLTTFEYIHNTHSRHIQDTYTPVCSCLYSGEPPKNTHGRVLYFVCIVRCMPQVFRAPTCDT